MTTDKDVEARPVCTICGKPISSETALEHEMGGRCKKIAEGVLKPRYVRADEPPDGYILLARVTDAIRKEKAKKNPIANLTVSKWVKSFGEDRGTGTLADEICQPIYVGRKRWVDAWLATQDGLKAIASGDFSHKPKPKAQ